MGGYYSLLPSFAGDEDVLQHLMMITLEKRSSKIPLVYVATIISYLPAHDVMFLYKYAGPFMAKLVACTESNAVLWKRFGIKLSTGYFVDEPLRAQHGVLCRSKLCFLCDVDMYRGCHSYKREDGARLLVRSLSGRWTEPHLGYYGKKAHSHYETGLDDITTYVGKLPRFFNASWMFAHSEQFGFSTQKWESVPWFIHGVHREHRETNCTTVTVEGTATERIWFFETDILNSVMARYLNSIFNSPDMFSLNVYDNFDFKPLLDLVRYHNFRSVRDYFLKVYNDAFERRFGERPLVYPIRPRNDFNDVLLRVATRGQCTYDELKKWEADYEKFVGLVVQCKR